MPKTAATLKAGLGYAMEKVIKTGLEGAVEVFGQENVKSAIHSLEKGLNWVDDNYTKDSKNFLSMQVFMLSQRYLAR
jgi:hypothetical protein